MPTVAVIHGPCLGGGLELALACRYRLAEDHIATQLGCPEVEVGLIPGWGATQRLPELIGLTAALSMILSGKPVSASQAAKRGLVDGAWPREQFAAEVEHFVQDRLRGQPFQKHSPSLLTWLGDRTRLGNKIVLWNAQRQIKKRSRYYPALEAALSAIVHGLQRGREAGLLREREAFAEILFNPACRHLSDLFFQREQAQEEHVGTKLRRAPKSHPPDRGDRRRSYGSRNCSPGRPSRI